MIKDKTTPELKSKFLEAINKTRETGKEHGFFLCQDDKENLSPSRLRSGEFHKIELGSPITECNGKKIQGDFHTHAYFTVTKKLIKPDTSDEEIKKLITDEHSRYKKELGVEELTVNSPSSKDILRTVLHSCIGMAKTTCVGSDMNDKVECWTTKNLPSKDCLKAHNMLFDDGKERHTVKYNKWMTSLFDKETIDLKK